MARVRRSVRETRAVVTLVVVVVVLGFIIRAIEGVGAFLASVKPDVYAGLALLLGGFVGLFLVIRAVVRSRRQKASEQLAKKMFLSRYNELFYKYGDNEIVVMIMNNLVWQGMTKEQLCDSLGTPEETSREVLKSMVREEYKYGQVGKNRFKRRIRIENDVVIGWSKK